MFHGDYNTEPKQQKSNTRGITKPKQVDTTKLSFQLGAEAAG